MRRLGSILILLLTLSFLIWIQDYTGALFQSQLLSDAEQSWQAETEVDQIFKKQMNEFYSYATGFVTGESFSYKKIFPNETRSFIRDILPFFALSASYMFASGILAVSAGIWVGMRLAVANRWVKEGLSFLSLMPGFALAAILQLSAVGIYQATGILVVNVASAFGEHALFLPFLSLFLVPFMYVVRLVSQQTAHVLAQDYILTAKAKGMGKTEIMFDHVLPNITPPVKAELFSLTSVVLGNLMVVEWIFNMPGMILFFLKDSRTVKDFAFQMNGLLAFLLIYILTYGGMRLVIYFLEKRNSHV